MIKNKLNARFIKNVLNVDFMIYIKDTHEHFHAG